MKKKVLGLVLIMLLSTITASAEHFWVTGKIKRTLVDKYYGGGMIKLDRSIGHGCKTTWVSLDLVGKYWSKESGQYKFSSALSAFAMDKRVSVYVYNNQKHNGYCVARRIDILK